jgi:antitoxin component HigA of HigAB toxin-antitoxin module
MSAAAVRSEYASLLTSTLPAVIRSEAENERHIEMLEELDRKGSRMSAAERRMAELLTLLIEDFETASIASEVLSGKRKLNTEHIRRLSRRFKVSPEIFF